MTLEAWLDHPSTFPSEPLPPGSAVNWLFVDLNSYFASVEQQDRPELRGKPVAVVPMLADTTCCIAASYEAKAYGVRTGTMVADAKRLCPDILLVEGRHEPIPSTTIASSRLSRAACLSPPSAPSTRWPAA